MQRILAVILASAVVGAAAVVVARGGDDGPATPRYVILEADGPLTPVVTTVGSGAHSVVAHADGAPDPRLTPLKATGEVFDFTDPNGGTWHVTELAFGEWTYWVVDVGPTLHDPTIDATYNAAFVVDASAIAEGVPLAFTELDAPLPVLSLA